MAASWFQIDTLANASLALEGDNPSKGVKMFKRLAERGNKNAQRKLGLIYEFGHSGSKQIVTPNIPEAIKWYTVAADNGDLEASDLLWQAYLHEGHVDEEKALYYLIIAAKKGAANAQLFLGICYMDGSVLPVPKNYSEGLKWLRKAAKSGAGGCGFDAAKPVAEAAQLELAKAYRDGTGVNVDLVKAYVWFSIAARSEVASQREHFSREKKFNSENPKYARPIKVEKMQAQVERDKISEQLTKDQLIDAHALVEKYIITNFEEFD